MGSRATWWIVPCALWLAPGWAGAVEHETPDRDDWLGRDKALHYSVSAGLAGAGYVGGALLFNSPRARLLTGAGVALSAGVAKELYDAGRGSFFSWKDLTWDALGTASGLALSWAVDRLFFSRPPPSPEGPGGSSQARTSAVTLSLDVRSHPQEGSSGVRNSTVSLRVVGGW